MPYTVSQVTLSHFKDHVNTHTHGPKDVYRSTASGYKECPKSVHVCIRLIHTYMHLIVPWMIHIQNVSSVVSLTVSSAVCIFN